MMKMIDDMTRETVFEDDAYHRVSYCNNKSYIKRLFIYSKISHMFYWKWYIPFLSFVSLVSLVLLWIIVWANRNTLVNVFFLLIYINTWYWDTFWHILHTENGEIPTMNVFLIVGVFFVINDVILCVNWLTMIVKRASRHHHVKSTYHLIFVYVLNINKTQCNVSYQFCRTKLEKGYCKVKYL